MTLLPGQTSPNSSSAVDSIKAIISLGALPSDKASCLATLMQSDDTFVPQEGVVWDFKREWPFSYSDEYFAAIARLICAFANTYGGLIIFGVHDQTRKGGHNKVNPNMDRLQQALSQLLSEAPALVLRRFDSENSERAVDVLLVRPLAPMMLPIRFTRNAGSYKLGVIAAMAVLASLADFICGIGNWIARSRRGGTSLSRHQRSAAMLPSLASSMA
jgi:hypothetical protein